MRAGWRRWLLGDRDRLGWWLLPLFVAVGLAGAVLAGSLAVVFASQRVDRLTRETASARGELATAADDVRRAADEAIAAVEREAGAVRDQLATELPYADAAGAGVVRLEVTTQVPDPDAPVAATVELRRTASGFVVAREDGDAFVATTFGLLVDPARPDLPLDVEVDVRSVAGTNTGRVHSWRADRDLLLLRVALPDVAPLPWRPAGADLAAGDRVTAVGLTPALGAARIGGAVAAADGQAVLTDLPPLELLAGGPVVDGEGRVVAVASSRYRLDGDPVGVPIRLLCDELLARCPD